MTEKHKGGCHCGNVTFTLEGKPELTFFCHCSDCQKTTGAPFSVELMVPADSFQCDGELTPYTTTGDSGKKVHRRACAHCGSGVYLECDADPGYVFLKAGALDDASWVRPEMHIYTGAKQPWINFADDLPCYEKAPPA